MKTVDKAISTFRHFLKLYYLFRNETVKLMLHSCYIVQYIRQRNTLDSFISKYIIQSSRLINLTAKLSLLLSVPSTVMSETSATSITDEPEHSFVR